MGDEKRIDTGGGGAIEGDVNADSFSGRDHIEPKSSSIVNVYTTPGQPRQPAKRKRKPVSMAATVDERVLYKLNEHDVKLAKLEMYREADQQTMLEYKRSLQEDIVEIKQELKPLFGQGLLASPQPNANKEEKAKAQDQNRLVIRLLTIIAISFGIAVLLGLFFLAWLALNRV